MNNQETTTPATMEALTERHGRLMWVSVSHSTMTWSSRDLNGRPHLCVFDDEGQADMAAERVDIDYWKLEQILGYAECAPEGSVLIQMYPVTR